MIRHRSRPTGIVTAGVGATEIVSRIGVEVDRRGEIASAATAHPGVPTNADSSTRVARATVTPFWTNVASALRIRRPSRTSRVDSVRRHSPCGLEQVDGQPRRHELRPIHIRVRVSALPSATTAGPLRWSSPQWLCAYRLGYECTVDRVKCAGRSVIPHRGKRARGCSVPPREAAACSFARPSRGADTRRHHEGDADDRQRDRAPDAGSPGRSSIAKAGSRLISVPNARSVELDAGPATRA